MTTASSIASEETTARGLPWRTMIYLGLVFLGWTLQAALIKTVLAEWSLDELVRIVVGSGASAAVLFAAMTLVTSPSPSERRRLASACGTFQWTSPSRSLRMETVGMILGLGTASAVGVLLSL